MAHRAESRRARVAQVGSRVSGGEPKAKNSQERELALCQAVYRAYQTLCTAPSSSIKAYHQLLQASSGDPVYTPYCNCCDLKMTPPSNMLLVLLLQGVLVFDALQHV